MVTVEEAEELRRGAEHLQARLQEQDGILKYQRQLEAELEACLNTQIEHNTALQGRLEVATRELEQLQASSGSAAAPWASATGSTTAQSNRLVVGDATAVAAEVQV